MYNIFVVFKCKDGLSKSFVERVKREGILDKVRAEDGCLRYDYYFSDNDPNEVLLIEAWKTKKHQQTHIEQPHMAQLREIKPDYVLTTTLTEYEIKK